MRFGPLPRITTLGRGVGIRLALVLERAVHVRRERLELGRAGVDALVGGARCPLSSRRARTLCFVDAEQHGRDRRRRIRRASVRAAARPTGRARPTARTAAASLDDLLELRQEPADRCSSADGSRRGSSRARARGTPPTCGGRSECPAPAAAPRRLPVVRAARPRLAEQLAALAELERPERLEERLP